MTVVRFKGSMRVVVAFHYDHQHAGNVASFAAKAALMVMSHFDVQSFTVTPGKIEILWPVPEGDDTAARLKDLLSLVAGAEVHTEGIRLDTRRTHATMETSESIMHLLSDTPIEMH